MRHGLLCYILFVIRRLSMCGVDCFLKDPTPVLVLRSRNGQTFNLMLQEILFGELGETPCSMMRQNTRGFLEAKLRLGKRCLFGMM